MSFKERTPSRARRLATLGLVLGATGVASIASPASAHTATATVVADCRNGQPVQSATFVNDWQEPATVVVGSAVLTLPGSGTVTTAVPAGSVLWSATWTDGFVEEGSFTVRGRTDCVPPVSNAPSTTAKAVPVAPPTTATVTPPSTTIAPPAAVLPAVEIGTATVLERTPDQPAELARTGRNTVWTVLAGFGFVVFGAAFAIVEKMMG
jgi:hypothetical protein